MVINKNQLDNLTKPQTPLSEGQIIKNLLEENLNRSGEILKIAKKIKNYLLWRRVWGVTKLLVIVAAILFGAVYLPPIIEKNIKPIQDLLNFSQTTQASEGELLNQLNELKKNVPQTR